MNTEIEKIPTRLELDRLTYRESAAAIERTMKLLSFIASRSDSIHLSNIANSTASLLLTACNMEKENSAFQENLKNLRKEIEQAKKESDFLKPVLGTAKKRK